MNSGTVVAGTEGWTRITVGTSAPRLMGAKSRSMECCARFWYSITALVAEKVELWNSSTCPSGAALATTSAPMEPPPPPRFSTRTETPNVSVRRWP
jgi:hypothetical protein